MIKYTFIPPGIQAQPANERIIFPSDDRFGSYQKGTTFLCDVGSYLGDGIIDHHTLDKENECATTLVYSENERLIDKVIIPDSPEYTIITHFDPDFDAIGCSYYVTKKILNQTISDNFKVVANYVLDVDLGKIQLDQNLIVTPFSMILAIANLTNEKYNPEIFSAEKERKPELIIRKNEEILKRSYELIDYILEKLDSGFGINDPSIWQDAIKFNPEIQLLNNDYQKYMDDFSRSHKYSISLFKKQTDESEVVDFIVTDSPKSILWKYWVRGDRKHTKNGYIFTCAFLDSYRRNNRNRAIIAIDRTTDFSIKGLGLALDEAEMRKIVSLNGSKSDAELRDMLQTGEGKRRNRYHRGDPWFDERDEFTIIDSPREGSCLNNEEITGIILAANYWQMLSKKLVDGHDNFFSTVDELFPDLFQPAAQHPPCPDYDEFFNKFDTGIFDSVLFDSLLSHLRNELLSTGEVQIQKGIYSLKIVLDRLVKLPAKDHLTAVRTDETKTKLLELIKSTLIKSGINDESFLQHELLKMIYLFYESKTVREILPLFKIADPKSFRKYYLYSIRKLNFQEILSFSFLFIEKNEISFFESLKNIVEEDNLILKNGDGLSNIFDILILLKQQSQLSFTPHQQPISSFDDWKDSIDDYLFFLGHDQKNEKLTNEFIKKDSSFFLDPKIDLADFNNFILTFNVIKNEIIFDDNFWNKYINDKTEIEHNFNKDNRFNILRKFTKSYIIECPLIDFIPYKKLLTGFPDSGSVSISAEFLEHTNLIYTIKIFEDLLNRIKLLVHLNMISKALNKFTMQGSHSDESEILALTFPVMATLRKLLNLLITSQYLADIAHYRSKMQEIIHEFSERTSSMYDYGYTPDQIALFIEIRDLLELINQKNSTPPQDYEIKLELLDKIILKIESRYGNLLKQAAGLLNEPERSVTEEIIFTLKCQLIHEKTFLNKKIRNNLKNETSDSRNNLKSVLNNIIKEATKDELRKVKQTVDTYSDENIKHRFYVKIIRPFRILSYFADKLKQKENENRLLEFNKHIRKKILNGNLSEAKLIKILDHFEPKNHSVPRVDDKQFLNMIIESQHEPNDATLLPESINIETYEFLVNHFLDKYSIDDAREKIDEYTISKYSKIFKFLTSWWILVLLGISITFSFLEMSFEKDPVVNNVNGIIISILTFLPLCLLLLYIIKFVSGLLFNLRKKKNDDEKNISVYSHISSYGANRINKLSFKLLLIEFMVPLALGILAAVQNNDLLYGLLKIGDFRLIAILPIIISLSYYSLFTNIASRNPDFSGMELNKRTFKIYLILFTQAWVITVSMLNIFTRYVFINSDTFNTDWKQVLTVGKIINFFGFDYLIFPAGTITITFISLFVGLFVESFNKKVKGN